jgi:secreted trypsin-like serine protease
MSKVKRRAGVASAFAIAALLALIATASAQSKGDPPAGASVVGGRSVKIEEYPWTAYLEAELSPHSGLDFSCTGAVIAPRVVLTAGHCVRDIEAEVPYSPSAYRVATGVTSHLHVPADHISRVSKVLVFPGFSSTFIHGDAGLLILTKPVAAPPLPMAGAADGALVAAGAPLEIAGWGLSNPAAQEGPALLRAGKLVIQSTARCRQGKTDLHKHFSPTQQLCALDTPDFHTSGCFGDSGGPAIAHRADGSPVEIGIVSAGGFECELREPNLYTRVDLVSQWASEWVAAVELGAPEPAIAQFPPPRMGRPEAEYLAFHALSEAFYRGRPSRRLGFAETIDLGCRRAARSKFRCHSSWQLHGSDYFGSISVFFLGNEDALTWSDRYTIHSVSDRCRRTAKNPRSCAVHTRADKTEKPKHVPGL